MVRRAPGPTESNPPEFAARWALRDWLAAAGLFAATATVVLWQNAHVAVLFDLSYILNTAERIALGQVPYRDFPLAHAPLTFLIQAAIIRITGRVFFHHVLYVAITGGLGTVLAWRIALTSLRGRVAADWPLALILAAPLIFLGVYCIVPTPEYDCDCGFWLLVAIWFLLQVDFPSESNPTPAPNEQCHPEQSETAHHPRKSKIDCHPERVPACRDESKDLRLLFGKLRRPHLFARGFAAGAALVIPLFFKQNMGLPFLLAAVGAVLLLLVLNHLPDQQNGAAFHSAQTPRAPSISAFFAEMGGNSQSLVALLAGACTTLLAALFALHCTAGLGNYVHWTIQYAGQRRLPALSLMLGVYRDPTLAWTLPCVVIALLLLWGNRWIGLPHPSRSPIARKVGSRWPQIAAFALLAAPFLFTLASLFIYDDADERGDALLALWPLVLLLAAALTLANLFALRRQPSLRIFLPLLLLAAIHGTFLSQQLWGSTYGIWPLLILLLAELLAFLGPLTARAQVHRWFTPALAAIISITLLVCGGFYTVSEERLSYANLPDGPAAHSAFSALAGLATPGPYLPEIDELLRYAQANIPFDDGIVLIPGEEPFYFATGRSPRFPVPFFDPTIDPYSPAEIVSLVQTHNIRWLIVKTDVQTKEDPTPDRAELLQLLMQEFTPAAHLHGYDVYRR
ncbi:MAG: hypothetical protein ABSA42_16775 [Terracidiphilus sp.]|jgi:hypothetical protein